LTWERSRSGLKPPLLSAARCAGSEGAGKTLKSPALEAPALHREAEHDTTGNFGRQHSLHTWIGLSVQGRRRLEVTV